MEKYDLAEIKAKSALDFSEFNNLIEEMAWSHETLVKIYSSWKKINLVREHFKQAIEIYRQLGNEVDIATMKVELAKAELLEGNPEIAITLFKESIQVYQEFNKRIKLAKAFRELGKCYISIGKVVESTDMLQKSLALFQQMLMESEASITEALMKTDSVQ